MYNSINIYFYNNLPYLFSTFKFIFLPKNEEKKEKKTTWSIEEDIALLKGWVCATHDLITRNEMSATNVEEDLSTNFQANSRYTPDRSISIE